MASSSNRWGDAKVRADEAASRVEQGTARPSRAGFPTASPSRGFFVSGGRFGQVRPAGNRGEVAASVGGRARLLRRQPAARRGRGRRVLHARDAALPVREPAYG